MKKLSIWPVVATLSLSIGAVAEGPSREQTLQYIQERCLNNPWGPRDRGTISMALDGAMLTLGSAGLPDNKLVWKGTTAFDFRDVEISAIDYEWEEYGYKGSEQVVLFSCGNKCITLGVSYYNLDGTLKTPGDPFGLRSHKIRCNDPEKVVKAFTHLQMLVGGQKKDLFGD